VDDLVNFLYFVLDNNNIISYVLYNYDNLPATSDEITYEFLSYNDDSNYKIGFYESDLLKRYELIDNLNTIKYIYNNY
jgi:hypothetical protein